MKISNAVAIAACDTVVGQIDPGASDSTLVIYDGSQPTDVDTAVSGQTALATFTLPATAFGNASDDNPGAIATANSISTVQADASSTATWFRVFDGDGNAVIDGNVSTSGADLNLNSTTITAGADVTINSWTITMPES